MTRVGRLAAAAMIGAVKLYQVTLSPVMGGQCRFRPTCSQYAIEALREHGPMRGGLMATRRVLRCNPFVRGGYDPVPPALGRGSAGTPPERPRAERPATRPEARAARRTTPGDGELD